MMYTTFVSQDVANHLVIGELPEQHMSGMRIGIDNPNLVALLNSKIDAQLANRMIFIYRVGNDSRKLGDLVQNLFHFCSVIFKDP